MFRLLLSLPLVSRIALTLWIALILGVTGRVAFSKSTSQTVVPIYLAAGERWNAAGDLYAMDTGLDIYRNPPGFAAAFALFTEWPEKLVAIGWRWFGIVLVLLGLWRIRWDLLPDLSAHRAAVFFSFAAILILPSVNNGQVNTLIAAGVLNGLAAMARKKWWQAAAWFTLGGWLKVYPLAVAFLGAILALRPLLPRLVILLAIAMSVPFVCHDPDYVMEQHRKFVHSVTADDRTWASLDRVPRDWTILPRTWLGKVPLTETTKLVSVLAGLAFAGLVIRSRRSLGWNDQLRSVLVYGSVWMTVFGPATESNTYSLMAGTVALVLVTVRSPWSRWLAAFGVGLLLSAIFRAMFPHDWTYTALGTQPLGTLLILASYRMQKGERPT
jgi:hypothetical protein